jgi:hypothetical protein
LKRNYIWGYANKKVECRWHEADEKRRQGDKSQDLTMEVSVFYSPQVQELFSSQKLYIG